MDYHHFLSNIFCLTVPKIIVGEPFSKSPFSGIEKIYASDGYVTMFYQKVFCLTVPKRFVEEPFFAVFQKISGSEKVYGEEGGKYQDFPSKNFCLTVPRNFEREPFRVLLISGIEKFYASEGFVTIICRNFFASQCQKVS